MTQDILQTRDAPGELLIWTNVEAAHEADFNRWYDREHMAERAAIPGFLWSRRYRATSGPRPYLALYRTQSVHVFLSAPYRKAFENQTAWSMSNFGRMFATTRRVNIVTELFGQGLGSALALIQLKDLMFAQRAADAVAAACGEADGCIGARVVLPDPELSTPLPSPGANNVIEPFLLIEATSTPVAAKLAKSLAASLGLAADSVSTFELLWDLRSADLGGK